MSGLARAWAGLRQQALARLLPVLFMLIAPLPARAETMVDLELVLAVDASGSVDEDEYRMQLAGIAAAFRSEAVLAAIKSGPRGRIAVALLVWADATTPKERSDWHVVSDEASAAVFALLVDTFPRRAIGSTGIGAAIAEAIGMITENAIDAPRRVVDVSGDGVETPLVDPQVILLAQARDIASVHGVIVNGLAIQSEVPSLPQYYRKNVITGFGSFVVPASGYPDFARAIHEKLLREIEQKLAFDARGGP
jgi:hypothetical protein